MLKALDLPPAWGALLAIAAWLWAEAVSLLPLPQPLSTWAGRALIVAGLALALWAAQRMWRRRTPIEPRRAPTALVTDGPFAWTRNPIYRALVMILAGWTLSCGEATGLVFPILYAQILTRRFILPEEAALRAAFGPAFETWAARVRWRL